MTKSALAILVVCAAAPLASAQTPTARALDSLPVSFERNVGQADPDVQFAARAAGYALLLTNRGTILRLPGVGDVQMTLVGASSHAPLTGEDPLPGSTNYLIGNDPTQWRTNVPTFARVRYARTYPGIDLVYYGERGRVEYDFVIAPGADPGLIRLAFDGIERMAMQEDGHLALHVANGTLTMERPVLYQEIDGIRQEVAGRFRMLSEREVGFDVWAYDRHRPLVIDPVLVYSTFLGGAHTAADIVLDSTGAAFVAGAVTTNFAITAHTDVFVAKINASGSALLFMTYLGGIGNDAALSLALNAAGDIYLTGRTMSADFPTVAAMPTVYGGGGHDAFVTRLNAAGNTLIYSTYLGGSEDDVAPAIVVDAQGSAFVAGSTRSPDLPVLSAAQPARRGAGDAFVAKYDALGNLVFATYLGGGSLDAAHAAALGTDGSLIVAGETSSFDFPTTPGAYQSTRRGLSDGFVARLSPLDGGTLSATLLGGDGYDRIFAVGVDAAGATYMTGNTTSGDFPVTAGAVQPEHAGAATGSFLPDVFVTKLSPDGAALVYSTYLGGANSDEALGIAVMPSGTVLVAGTTWSTDFPLVAALQPSYGDVSIGDSFVTKIAADGSTAIYSTYWSGTIHAIAVGSSGDAYLTGDAFGPSYPTTPGALLPSLPGSSATRAFVTRLSDATPPCSYSVRPSIVVGGPSIFLSTNEISVVAPSGCAWTAVSDAVWLEVTPDAGTGVDVLQYRLAFNAGTPRVGSITVGNAIVTVYQPGPGCSYSVPPVATQPSTGGSVVATLTTGADCPWVVSSLGTWATAAPASGVGSSPITFTLQPNTGVGTRTSFIAVGQTYTSQTNFSISQAGTCDVTLSSTTTNMPRPGGIGFITLTASPPGCAWSVQSDTSWLVPSSHSGTGSGAVGFAVEPNMSMGFRLGHLVIGAKTFRVVQDGPQFLDRPGVLPPSPAAGSGLAQTFVFTFHRPQGAPSLDVVNVLVNEFLDGRVGCYVAYVPSINVLYLVNDPGDALLPGLVLNGSTQQTGNSQCLIDGSGSSAVTTFDRVTLTLRIVFQPSFAGNKVVYQAARDVGGGNSGWVQQGVWHVPGADAGSPAVLSLTPARGGGAGSPFTFTFRDADGFADLVSTTVLINNYLDGGGACYLGYHVPSNTVLLLNDPGNAYLPALALGGTGTVENSQCRIRAQGSTVAGHGTDLTLTLVIEFKTGFAGERVFYLSAQDSTTTSGWQALGSWTVAR